MKGVFMTKEKKLLGFLKSSAYKPMTADEIKVSLDVSKKDEKLLYEMLDKFEREGLVLKNKKGRYKACEQNIKSGTLRLLKTGGFVDAGDEEIFIKSDDLCGAFDKDFVNVKKMKEKSKEKCAEGVITGVLKRGAKTLIGTFFKDRYSVSFKAFDMRIPVSDFIIERPGTEKLEDGDLIEVDIIRYPENGLPMKVRFKDKIGKKDEFGADTKCLLKIFGIPEEFSSETIKQAEDISEHILEKDIIGRKDFRKLKVITIDSEDARDLDDAVHVSKRGGVYTLHVHIADVSHYVAFESPIDKDAQKRGTSVYFPDRVVPMLPVKLSNGICSLNPNEDRLTLSVMMKIDENGEFISYEIEKGIIRSCERMTYKTVSELIEGSADTETKKRYKHINTMLLHMRDLAEILKKRRIKQGYIAFNVPEVKFMLDENGKAIDVFKYEEGVSNGIIEQFMLMANEAVALFGQKHKLPFIYRVHEAPDSEKEQNLRDILKFYNVYINGEITPVSVAEAIEKLKYDESFHHAVSSCVLRCMMKARYSEENLGHFGLGCENYLHFTSPIRRYPDLQVHRVISDYLSNNLKAKRLKVMESFTKEAAAFSTETELRATEAEREADKLKACEYMQNFIGCKFSAVISSVTDFGLFVALSNAVEGFISMNDLKDDYYVHEKESYRLKGEKRKNTFALGDELTVKLKSVDLSLRRIDFEIDGMEDIKHSKNRVRAVKNIIETKKKQALRGRNSRKKFLKRRGKRRK